MNQDLVSVILEAVKELNEEQALEVPQDLTADTPLFGPNGLLDSMGLVSLVVAVEQSLQDRFGVTVSLADEKAMSQANSPYRTIGSLADYASAVMDSNE